MKPRTARMVGLALVIVSAGALGASVVRLGRNLADRNVHVVRFVGRITGEQFTFQGQEGSVEHVAPEHSGDDPILRVHWRGQSVDFPIPFTDEDPGEGLDRYAEWFSIMLLVDGADSEDALREKWTAGADDGVPDVVPRLVVAGRYPAEGFDRGSWGLVRRQEWQYHIAQLEPDGPPEDSIDAHTMSYEELDALYLPGKYTEKRFILPEEERSKKLWMYYAMQHVTPPAQYRGRNKMSDDVVRSMGWAWPAATVATLGIVAGIALFASASVQRPH